MRDAARQDEAVPPSPEFVMPPEPMHPAPAPAEAPAVDRPDPLTEERDPQPSARAQRPWRQLAIAALVGVVVGAGIPASFEAADRAATDARAERLRDTAMAYLEAIAAGESDLATEMVPVEAEIPAEAVLRSADPIEEPEVRLVAIDGDAATVEVSYEIAGRSVTRPLEAEEVDGEWRVRTSIAEAVFPHVYVGMPDIVVAGVVLPQSGRLMLYPGRYESDRVTTPIITTGGQRFEVDGDPTTSTELFPTVDLAPGMSRVVRDVAVAHLLACGERAAAAACAMDADADVDRLEGPYVNSVDARTGAVDLWLQLPSRGSAGQMYEMVVRGVVDESGALVSWECGGAGHVHHDLEPCRG